MPYANPSELPAIVRNALPAHGQDIFIAAFNSAYEGTCNKEGSDRETCANKIAWYAVGKAYQKDEQSGEWKRMEEQLTNIEVCSEPISGITSFHDVDLQRLDVFMDYAGKKVRHTKEHFANTGNWERIPVIFQKTSATVPGVHPDFNAVTTNTIDPAKYINVGYIDTPHLSESGEPSLAARVVFNNQHCSLMAEARELSLSTGFAAPTRTLDDGRKEIAGQVQPNHVLIFKRGSCPNCYPNDNLARFKNLAQTGDDDMDDESKGILNKILVHFENLTKKTPAVEPEVKTIMEMKNVEDVEALKAEIAALKKKIAELEGGTSEMKNLTEQYKTANAEAKTAFENIVAENKDLKWTLLKNVLPLAWVDTAEHEAASREKYEKTPAVFVAELAKFTNQKPADKPAQGDAMTNMTPTEEDGYGTINYKKEVK